MRWIAGGREWVLPSMADNDYAKITEIASDIRTCMLTSSTPDGSLHSRPMSTQTIEFDGDAWFFAPRNSSLVNDIATRPTVNVAYSGSSSWLSLSGEAVVIEDETKKAQLWNKYVEAWFPDGASDPNVILVRVHAQSAEYWDTPGGKPLALLKMAQARLTGDEPEPGSSGAVDLR